MPEAMLKGSPSSRSLDTIHAGERAEREQENLAGSVGQAPLVQG